MPYIYWSILQGFGVIDVNVPSGVPKSEVSFRRFPHEICVAHMLRSQDENDIINIRGTEKDLTEKISELVCYLWDNYLEGYESSDIVVMGVGYSYIGIRELLWKRGSCVRLGHSQLYAAESIADALNPECRSKIRGILNFVNGTLRSVRSTETDPDLPSWYKHNSRAYVAANHLCWQDDEHARKVGQN